jgi:hypothetical protein
MIAYALTMKKRFLGALTREEARGKRFRSILLARALDTLAGTSELAGVTGMLPLTRELKRSKNGEDGYLCERGSSATCHVWEDEKRAPTTVNSRNSARGVHISVRGVLSQAWNSAQGRRSLLRRQLKSHCVVLLKNIGGQKKLSFRYWLTRVGPSEEMRIASKCPIFFEGELFGQSGEARGCKVNGTRIHEEAMRLIFVLRGWKLQLRKQ